MGVPNNAEREDHLGGAQKRIQIKRILLDEPFRSAVCGCCCVIMHAAAVVLIRTVHPEGMGVCVCVCVCEAGGAAGKHTAVRCIGRFLAFLPTNSQKSEIENLSDQRNALPASFSDLPC